MECTDYLTGIRRTRSAARGHHSVCADHQMADAQYGRDIQEKEVGLRLPAAIWSRGGHRGVFRKVYTVRSAAPAGIADARATPYQAAREFVPFFNRKEL